MVKKERMYCFWGSSRRKAATAARTATAAGKKKKEARVFKKHEGSGGREWGCHLTTNRALEASPNHSCLVVSQRRALERVLSTGTDLVNLAASQSCCTLVFLVGAYIPAVCDTSKKPGREAAPTCAPPGPKAFLFRAPPCRAGDGHQEAANVVTLAGRYWPIMRNMRIQSARMCYIGPA